MSGGGEEGGEVNCGVKPVHCTFSFVARKVELMAQEKVLAELIELITGLVRD